jgi:hypothetical protein
MIPLLIRFRVQPQVRVRIQALLPPAIDILRPRLATLTVIAALIGAKEAVLIHFAPKV